MKRSTSHNMQYLEGRGITEEKSSVKTETKPFIREMKSKMVKERNNEGRQENYQLS